MKSKIIIIIFVCFNFMAYSQIKPMVTFEWNGYYGYNNNYYRPFKGFDVGLLLSKPLNATVNISTGIESHYTFIKGIDPPIRLSDGTYISGDNPYSYNALSFHIPFELSVNLSNDKLFLLGATALAYRNLVRFNFDSEFEMDYPYTFNLSSREFALLFKTGVIYYFTPNLASSCKIATELHERNSYTIFSIGVIITVPLKSKKVL